MSGLASGSVGDPLRDGVPVEPAWAYTIRDGKLVESGTQAAGSGGVPDPGPSIESSEGEGCDPLQGLEAAVLGIEAAARRAQAQQKPRGWAQYYREACGRLAAPADEASAPEGAHPKLPSLGAEGVGAAEGAGLGVGDAAQEFFKFEAQVHGFTSAIGLDGSVDPTVRRTNADGPGHPPARVRIECRLDRGEHLLVVGGYGYAFNELRLHGFLSTSDVQILGYAISSLRVAAEQAERVGCRGYALSFHGEGPCAMVLQSWAQLLRAVKCEVYGPGHDDSEQWQALRADLLNPDEWSLDEEGRPFCFSTELGETSSMTIVRLSDSRQVII